jgi:hypothetical protein
MKSVQTPQDVFHLFKDDGFTRQPGPASNTRKGGGAESRCGNGRDEARGLDTLLVCGGGVHNDYLSQRLVLHLPGVQIAPPEIRSDPVLPGDILNLQE